MGRGGGDRGYREGRSEGGGGGTGGVLDTMHGRGRMTLLIVDSRILAGGRTRLLLALVIWRLTTHPFRAGAPSFLLVDTSNCWALVTLFPYCIPGIHENFS